MLRVFLAGPLRQTFNFGIQLVWFVGILKRSEARAKEPRTPLVVLMRRNGLNGDAILVNHFAMHAFAQES